MADTKLKTQKAKSKKVENKVKKVAAKSSRTDVVKVAAKPVRKPAKKEAVEAVMSVQAEKSTRASKKPGLSAEVYGLTGEKVDTVNLPAEIFGVKVNEVLLSQAIRVYQANQRAGTASTKTRGEVEGSTRKIYRQKGTGRARHGAIRAPIFVGGGIVFGPRPRDFSLELPQKMRRAALFSALTAKLQGNRVIIADINTASGKTSEMYKMLKVLQISDKKRKGFKVLFVIPSSSNIAARGLRNINGVKMVLANQLNALDVMINQHVVLLKESIDILKSTYIKEK